MPVLHLEMLAGYSQINDFHPAHMIDEHSTAEADDICGKAASAASGPWCQTMLTDSGEIAGDAVDIHSSYELHSDGETYPGPSTHDKVAPGDAQASSSPPCQGCGAPIADRYLLRAAGACWHESCLRCSVCASVLTSSCFVKDRRLLCRHDYARLYGARCTSCFLPLPPQEMVMRAQGRVYHVRCFTCVVCGHLLQQGDQYVIHNEQLFCRLDFEKEFAHMRTAAMMLGPDCYPLYSPKSDCDDSLDDNDGDPNKGPKRPRTILTTSQRRKFKSAFELNPKPCRKVRESLAQETGLSVRVVQVWFQNQRAKMKKIARKQSGEKELDKKGTAKEVNKRKPESTEKSNSKKTKVKPSGESHGPKKENSFAQQLTALNSSSSNVYTCSTLDTAQSYHSHHMNDLENIMTDHAQGHGDLGRCHDALQAPIDRLFCMQDSYFSPP